MAAALGPPIGGFLVELSWRWIFFVNVPVGVLALVAGLPVLAKTTGTGTGIPDLFGALSLIVEFGVLNQTVLLRGFAIGTALMIGPFLARSLVRRVRPHTYALLIDLVLVAAAAGMFMAARAH